MNREMVIVLDFGGQYNQLVARRVRECNVYCEIYSYRTDIEKIKAMNPKGIILTGGPNSCYEPDSPTYTDELFKLGIPVLGLCYGAQLMSHVLGGKVERADVREYGKTKVLIDKKTSKVFEGVSPETICWMSHFDYISKIAPGFEITAHTADCPVAAAENEAEKLYAIQFHPEVLHTAEGTKMINNFVKNVCECAGDWKMDAFVEHTVKEIREKVGNGRVLLALSGGVDSSYLLYAAMKYGADVKAYYVKALFQPQFEMDDAMRLAEQLKAPVRVLRADVLSDPVVVSNPSNRCYYCKKVIFNMIMKAAAEDGYTVLLDGTNASDDAGDRPGMKALQELQVKSPLRECGLVKSEIRRLSKEGGLFTWDKPSYACLATRIPTGCEITAEKLQKTEAAEDFLFSIGFSDFRVRMMPNGAARLQLPENQLPLLMEKRAEILNELKKHYPAVLLDLEVRG